MATNTTITNIGLAGIVDGVLGTQMSEPKHLQIGSGGGARTAAATDTALTTPVAMLSTNSGTSTTVNVADDTYTVNQTYTATGSVTINEAGLFDAASAGNMFLSATFPDVGLLSGDTIQITVDVTFS